MSDADGRVTSATHICNLALTAIGHQTITSLDQGNKAASLCSLHYHPRRRQLLRMHPWNFAIARVALASDNDATPAFGFDYAFRLPEDCLKVIRTSWEEEGVIGTAIYGWPGIHGYQGGGIAYRIEGRYLLANESTASIEYIRNETDVAKFDDLFVDLLAARVAFEICMPLTDNAALTKGMREAYELKLAEAQVTDAQEGTPREVVDLSGWLTSRG